MAMIGIDSMVLIYAGIVPSANSAVDKELRISAKMLLHMHQADAIVLPTIAISELLVPVDISRHGLLIAKLSEMFICRAFDLHAASIAADLWAKHKRLPPNDQYKQRQVLRADSMIVASAKAAGADVFYTHDKKFRALAGLVMKAKDLPKDDNTDMFIRGDIERGEA